VLTCALVDESYAKALDYGSNMRYTSAYYYMRLRNYRKLQADRAINGLNNNSMYRWEIILFDLNTLQTRCVMQTKSFSMNDARMAITSVPAQAIKKMLDEKVIQKQLVPDAAKPF
jgi:hypothetical protein